MGKKDQAAAAENIKVLVRCRPFSEKESAMGHKSCVDLDMAQNTVTVKSIIGEPDRWTFDAVINNSFSQEDIFTQFIMPLTESVLSGFNATVFAYGQSGSGKTHTMTGVMGNSTLEGVIPRCVMHIFDSVQKMKNESPSTTVSMYVSFMELYNGKVRDLLAKQQVSLDIRENKDHTFFVKGAVVAQVKFPEDVIRHLEEGTDRRRVASTELNADSSRSHSVFSLILECTETLEDGSTRAVSSKLNLVDLAGSERQGKTGASGDTLKEGCNINLSLSALGTVIDTIVKGGTHVPFRSSPLTMLLKDSLGGNSKTVMFANINPSERNMSETVSTLRFADRAKQIKNKPVVNMDSKDQKIAELTEIVKELREKLAKYETQGTAGLEEEVVQLQEKIGQLEVQLDNATKSREADLVDYEMSKATLAAERQTFNTRLLSMEDEIAQLQNQLQISESGGAAMQSQLNDVWTQCYNYFLTPTEKAAQSLEQLQVTLTLEEVLRNAKKKVEGGGESSLKKIQSLTADLKVSQAEHRATKKELKTSKAQLERHLAELKEELAEWKRASVAPGNSIGDGQAAVGMGQQQDYTMQEKLLAAIKLDDKGAAAIKLLREENEKLRHQLMPATSPLPDSTAALAAPQQNSASISKNATADSAVLLELQSSTSAAAQKAAAISSLQAELEEAKAKVEHVTASRESLYAELEAQRTELTNLESTVAQHDRQLAEMQQEYEVKLAAATRSEDEVARLEARLRERSDQLEQMRTLLEKQKAIIIKNNEKAEYFQISLREKTEALVVLEQQFREQLENKDAQMQQLINKRVAEFSEQRSAELNEKSLRQKKLKKKLHKLQEELSKWEERFDMKVCECEDLRKALEEKKVEQMRLLRRIELSDDEAEALEQKEQIQNALERAKQERRRKDDLFAMGEVRSAKSVVRRGTTDPSDDAEYP
ncbi:putative OSM3-like kinesin [Leishmania mexicana MHOM/GT/2001/U1103]|uniref:Kinesin-like protein n=1 Tax=Leishmania mexicana (strain MHOM/GT/2001/U1103) TaxID=929439 RepID=E9AR52_LEIMU|nr:putative OSM3-like kinesin [Leishmania mexicana MHOM/GT/2001/U1103]CBZ25439.1 putative OSM3-like kinesin [Leishmania mexicana MHOM/GT/2001/U1103]